MKTNTSGSKHKDFYQKFSFSHSSDFSLISDEHQLTRNVIRLHSNNPIYSHWNPKPTVILRIFKIKPWNLDVKLVCNYTTLCEHSEKSHKDVFIVYVWDFTDSSFH